MIQSKPKENKESCIGIIRSAIIATLVTVLFIIFVGQFMMVSGTSMVPTYKSGDLVFVEKLSTAYDRFDVIIIDSSVVKENIVKRVIGLPCESVQIIEGTIYINDSPIDDYIKGDIEYAGTASEKIILGENEYFVVGDNRAESLDSRYEEIGNIDKQNIIGKVIFRI